MRRDPEAPRKDETHRSPISFIACVYLNVLAFLPWNVALAVSDRVPRYEAYPPSVPEETRKKLEGLGNTPSGSTLPGGTVPGGTVPGGPVSGGTVPGGTVPGGPVPGGTLP